MVGRDAAHSARTAPERYEPNPKRRIDEQTVLLGDAELPVVELIAAVLRAVAVEAERVAGGPIADATLTRSAAWAHTRRQILVRAAERAGLPPVALVPEPVAAADTFLAVSGGTVPVGSSVVVYDLGAGTFDASVVRRGPNGYDVVAAEGLSQAGGLDIDAAIVHEPLLNGRRHGRRVKGTSNLAGSHYISSMVADSLASITIGT
jgi:molecular chaperone DnaK (HSP70)